MKIDRQTDWLTAYEELAHELWGWEVPYSVICKWETQASLWCHSSQSKGRGTREAYAVNPHSRAEVGYPSSYRQAESKRGQFAILSLFCSTQALNGSDDAQSHWTIHFTESSDPNYDLTWEHPHTVCYMLLSQLQLLVILWMSDVHSVLSSTVLLSSYRLISIYVSLFHVVNLANVSLPLLLLPSYFFLPVLFTFFFFSKNTACVGCAHSRRASVLSFLPLATFQALFHLATTCLSFWWSQYL